MQQGKKGLLTKLDYMADKKTQQDIRASELIVKYLHGQILAGEQR